MLGRCPRPSCDQRGVVSVEWIVLAAVIMVAALLAFAPNFSGVLTSAVSGVSTQLQTQINMAGS